MLSDPFERSVRGSAILITDSTVVGPGVLLRVWWFVRTVHDVSCLRRSLHNNRLDEVPPNFLLANTALTSLYVTRKIMLMILTVTV